MSCFRQAKWTEPLIFEMQNSKQSSSFYPPISLEMEANVRNHIPNHLKRTDKPNLPRLSEVEVVRHFTRLSQMSFGVDTGFYPLGSCTMKYNPKIGDLLASLDKVHWVHPHQPEDTMQGTLEIMYKLAQALSQITGTNKVSLQPAAGAHGELLGTLIIRAFHRRNGELFQRDEIIVPDSAHGTNPASAVMAGFKAVVVPSNKDGCIDIELLKAVVSKKTAGIMLTNPNTLGIFEKDVLEITRLIHEAGGLAYYDGANLNALLGKIKPGEMGFDVVHVNLHKTFSTPHGGGGPGGGPIGVKDKLKDFLPIPTVELDSSGRYRLNYDLPYSIGKISAFYGNFEAFVRAYVYILLAGFDGLERASNMAVLNANYLASKLSSIRGFEIPFGRGRLKHEFVMSCSKLKFDTGVSAKNVAKRLLDYGVHSPTIYFPSIVNEALMIEPTETESIDEMNKFIEIMAEISHEAYTNAKITLGAPYNTACNPVDEVKASHPRTMCLSWRMHKNRDLENAK